MEIMRIPIANDGMPNTPIGVPNLLNMSFPVGCGAARRRD